MEGSEVEKWLTLIDAATSASMSEESSIFCWFCPPCPNPECDGILGQKFGSLRLVCMTCKTEFTITEVKTR